MAKRTRLESDTSLLDYMSQHIDEKFAENNARFDKIDTKLESLLEFKWQIVGGSIAVSAIISAVIAVILK